VQQVVHEISNNTSLTVKLEIIINAFETLFPGSKEVVAVSDVKKNPHAALLTLETGIKLIFTYHDFSNWKLETEKSYKHATK